MSYLSRAVFGFAGLALMILAASLILFSGYQVYGAFRVPDHAIGSTLLEAVGYVVIAIAVFDVGKYFLEEEVVRERELRTPGEARRSMTKFVTTISIAVFLEGLVTVFEVSKQNAADMLYPTFLLLAGVAMLIGLGVFQRLSTSVEKDVEHKPEDQPGAS